MINITKKYLSGNDVGRTGYQWCLENGQDPREYADTVAGRNKIGVIADRLSRQFVSEHLPEELPFYDQCKIGILREFMQSAREANDKETTAYVSKLLRQLRRKSKP